MGAAPEIPFDSAAMTKEQAKRILDRVLTWPAEWQADVAHVVELMEAQDKSELQLTAEVRRRLANPSKDDSGRRRVQTIPFAGPMRVTFEPAARIEFDHIFTRIAKDTPRARLPFGQCSLMHGTPNGKKLPSALGVSKRSRCWRNSAITVCGLAKAIHGSPLEYYVPFLFLT